MEKRDYFYASVFLFGIILFCFMTRYSMISSTNQQVVYRINRITGKAAFTMPISEQWIPFGGEAKEKEK